jgi:hypothetical protein
MTWLEEQGCPQGLRDAWMGHAGVGMASKYDKTAEDWEFRRRQVERIGTGLNLADALIPQITKPGPHAAQAAKKPGTSKDPKAEIVVKRSLVRRKPQSVIAEEVVAVEDHYVASDEDLPDIFSTPVAEEV